MTVVLTKSRRVLYNLKKTKTSLCISVKRTATSNIFVICKQQLSIQISLKRGQRDFYIYLVVYLRVRETKKKMFHPKIRSFHGNVLECKLKSVGKDKMQAFCKILRITY